MAERISEDRLQLIHSYMEESVRGEPVEAERGRAESDGAAPARRENESDELAAPIAFPDPAAWHAPEPVRFDALRWRVAVFRHSQIASVLALVGFALALGWLVAHMS